MACIGISCFHACFWQLTTTTTIFWVHASCCIFYFINCTNESWLDIHYYINSNTHSPAYDRRSRRRRRRRSAQGGDGGAGAGASRAGVARHLRTKRVQHQREQRGSIRATVSSEAVRCACVSRENVRGTEGNKSIAYSCVFEVVRIFMCRCFYSSSHLNP